MPKIGFPKALSGQTTFPKFLADFLVPVSFLSAAAICDRRIDHAAPEGPHPSGASSRGPVAQPPPFDPIIDKAAIKTKQGSYHSSLYF
jgi:hypothetical protein